jgi:hypothetical protein
MMYPAFKLGHAMFQIEHACMQTACMPACQKAGEQKQLHAHVLHLSYCLHNGMLASFKTLNVTLNVTVTPGLWYY